MRKPSLPAISVVIVTRNRKLILAACLASLKSQSMLPDELVVVDNGSTDGTADYVRQFARTAGFSVRSVTEPRPGYPIVYNTGLKRARYEWVAFIDDDCVADADWYETAKHAVAAHAGVAAVMGKSTTFHTRSVVALSAAFNEHLWKRGGMTDGGVFTDYAVLDNKNVVYNRRFLTEHGLSYTEESVAVAHGACEDADLGLKIQAASGVAVYEPAMRIIHKDPTALSAVWRKLTMSDAAYRALVQRWSTARPQPDRRRIPRSTRAELVRFSREYRLPSSTAALLVLLLYVLFGLQNARRAIGAAYPRYRLLASAVLIALCTAGIFRWQASTAATGYRADTARTGAYAYSGRDPSWWTVNLHGKSASAPVIAGSTLYVGGTQPHLYAVDIPTGRVLWTFTAQDDIPFSPSVSGDTVYAASVDGIIYAIDTTTGRERWRFRTPDFFQIATSPLVMGGTVYAGVYDGVLYALDAKTGAVKWKYEVGSFMESSPVSNGTTVIVGAYDGTVRAVDAGSGRQRWTYKTAGGIVSSPALAGSVLIVTSRDGYVYALDAGKGVIRWKFKADAPLTATPVISGSSVYVLSPTTIYALNLSSGALVWKSAVSTGWYASPAVEGGIVFVPSTDGHAYAFDARTGTKRWTYAAGATLEAPPSVAGRTVFLSSSDGYLHAVDKATGKTNLRTPQTIRQLYSTVGRGQVFELAVTGDDTAYINPQTDVRISAEFVKKGNANIRSRVSGFYYDKNEWRVRFAATESGTWEWQATAAFSPAQNATGQGTFECTDTNDTGFIRPDPENPYRFIDASGTIFHPIGLSDELNDPDNDNYPLNTLMLDQHPTDISTYLTAMGRKGAGFNIFRWSVENASFPLMRYDAFTVPEPPLVKNGMWGDKLVSTAKQNGMRVMMAMFGFYPPYASGSGEPVLARNGVEKHQIESYVSYVVARYAAYVDIWELSNEATVTKPWLDTVLPVIEREDPYHHPISISWEDWSRTDPRLTVTAPHWYENESELDSDMRMAQETDRRRWGKPILFGEQGNRDQNWDETSGLRMRLRMWSGLFNEAGLIFWNTSKSKNFRSPHLTSNVYIGPEERSYVRVFRSFLDGLRGSVRPAGPVIVAGDVRQYRIQTDAAVFGYLHHYADHQTKVTTEIQVDPSVRSRLTWIDPVTGKETDGGQVLPGPQTVTSLPFTVDLAYRIVGDK